MRLWKEYLGIVLAVVSLYIVIIAYQEYTIPANHKPKFAYGQCFTKMGLREPWEPEVAGRVYSRGYTKYLVMYADEANRVTLAPKSGWEEEIRVFDSKYRRTLCPENWRKHTHEKNHNSNKERHQEWPP